MQMYFFYVDKLNNVKPEFFEKLSGDLSIKFKNLQLDYIFFQEKSSKKIVNSLTKKLGDKVHFVKDEKETNIDERVKICLSSSGFVPCIVCRDEKMLSDTNTIVSMIESYQKGNDIVTTKKIFSGVKAKIKNFFRGIANRLLSMIYRCRFYEGNENLILFSEYAVNSMKSNIKNVQKFSKVNCFVKMNEDFVETKNDVVIRHSVKQKDKDRMIIFLEVFFALLLLEILLGIFVPVINKIYIHGLFIIFEIVCLALACLDILKIYINYKVGPLYEEYYL